MDEQYYPAIKWLMLILIFSTYSNADCPLKCTCLNNQVKCVDKSLSAIPNLETLNTEPILIDISGNNIDFIGNYDFSFDKAESVEKLFLNRSKIVDIDYTAFMEMTNLTEINLSDNLLQHLPNDLFKYNEHLTHLDLAFNKFSSMPLLISTSLIDLNLMNSGLNKVDNKSLIKLPNLKHLNLKRNHIKSVNIAVFEHLHLSSIDLSFNPWLCNCKNVKLFNYFYFQKVLVLDKNIQCKGHHGKFIDVFNQLGPTQNIENFCLNSNSTKIQFNEKILKNPNDKINSHNAEINEEKLRDILEFLQNSIISKYILLFLIILTSFFCGYFYASFRVHQKIENFNQDASSCNTLLKKSELV